MNHVAFARNLVREQFPEWTVNNESTLTCPCGHLIEWDGECPSGHVSPIRQLGLI